MYFPLLTNPRNQEGWPEVSFITLIWNSNREIFQINSRENAGYNQGSDWKFTSIPGSSLCYHWPNHGENGMKRCSGFFSEIPGLWTASFFSCYHFHQITMPPWWTPLGGIKIGARKYNLDMIRRSRLTSFVFRIHVLESAVVLWSRYKFETFLLEMKAEAYNCVI